MQKQKVQQTKYSSPVKGLGLVTEGGGQRGAFTAGVLDSWLIAQFNPFEILVGTSAGAQNLGSFLSQQTGYAYSLIADLTRQARFFNPWRFFKGQNVMDLDWYFSQTKCPSYCFDNQQASRNAKGRKVRFSASHLKGFDTKLLDPVKKGWLESMQSSSAIPYLYKSESVVDGGVTAPVPIKQAHKLGANTIVTIRTSDGDAGIVPKPIKRLKPLLCGRGKCPTFMKIVDQHETAYLAAERFIEEPPQGIKVFEIKPTSPLATKTLGSSKEAIIADYKQGIEIGSRFINQYTSRLLAS